MDISRRWVKFSRPGLVLGPVLGLVLLLAGVMAFAAPRVFAQTGPNAKLQAEVASKLSHEPALKGQSIMVNANGSRITLSGTVQTEKQWQEAETVAANVSGVRTILNDLAIAGQNGNGQSENSANPNGEMAPPAPDLEQPQTPPAPPAPPSPASPNAENQTGIPPPPPPDQTSQGNHIGQASGQTARPAYQGNGYQGNGYQGNGYQGQGYGQGYGVQNSQNGYNRPPQPSGPVTVPSGTLLQIRTIEPLDSAHLGQGESFDATVARDVWEGNVLAIPRGATLTGEVVTASEPRGKLGGKPRLDLRLTSLSMGGQQYRLDTDLWRSVGSNKAGYTAGNTATGGLLGAIIGGIVGRGPGAAIGAGVGAITALGASSATKGPRIYIPSEAVLNFRLARPVTVQPVSWREARRLDESWQQLQRRDYRVPGPYRYPPPYSARPYYSSPYAYYGPSGYSFGWAW